MILARQNQDARHLVEGGLQQGDRFGTSALEGQADLAQPRSSAGQIGSPEDLLGRGKKGFDFRFRAGIAQVPKEMRLTALPARSDKAPLDGLHQACMIVGDDQVHPAETTLLQAGEEAFPTCLALLVSEGESQQMPMPRFVDSRGNQ